jgi:hypothetical protein
MIMDYIYLKNEIDEWFLVLEHCFAKINQGEG